MKRWIFIAVLAAVLAWGSVEHRRVQEQAAHYAEVIAHCANGGQYMIGETWLVSCKGKKVPAVY